MMRQYTHRYDWVRVYYKSTASRDEDYLETADYFFRYDRGVTNVRPKSLVGRLVFGKLMSSSQWLRLGKQFHWLLADKKPTVTLDVFVPFTKVPEFLAWYEREFNFYPLWCVPYRRVRDYEWLDDSYWAQLGDDLFLDLAIYGMRQRDERNAHRMMEEKAAGDRWAQDAHLAQLRYGEAGVLDDLQQAQLRCRVEVAAPIRTTCFRDLYTKTCKARRWAVASHRSSHACAGPR